MIPAAREADYLLVLHDDTALDPDAVTRLVEAAIGMRVENVGVAGPRSSTGTSPDSSETSAGPPTGSAIRTRPATGRRSTRGSSTG